MRLIRRVTRPASGSPLRAWLPDIARNVAETPVHHPSPRPGRHGARALTDTTGIHVSGRPGLLGLPEGDALLAHEAVHAAQLVNGGAPAGTAEAELEAHRLAPDALAGRPVRPSAAARGPLFDTESDKAAVAAARRRLDVLERFESEWQVREIRRLRERSEVEPLLEKRRRIERYASMEREGAREGEELSRIAALNRRPLDIRVTDDAVTFRVRFHVRFEDAKMASRFGELEENVRAGIHEVFDRTLPASMLGGRRFTVEPEFTLVSPTAARNQDFWLITVRARDDAPAVYEGTKLADVEGGVPTSVTESTVAGGVMSIPPLHIEKADVLGHESIHLLGLVDRYIGLLAQPDAGKPKAGSISFRDTGGRADPLGGDQGPLLKEDLAFAFEQLGVYRLARGQGLDTLQELERKGMTIESVRIEMVQQRRIIERGGPEPSLFKPREDFRDKVLRGVDDL